MVKKMTRIPGSVAAIYANPMPGTATGQDNERLYSFRNMWNVAIDIHPDDARVWEREGKIRVATTAEVGSMDGYIARVR